jgi:eukaryotic-like serine/threonine-protein kinase
MNQSEARSLDPLQTAPSAFGRFRLLADIGRGGMADVYLAVTEGGTADAEFRKLLVVKLLRAERSDDPEFVKMFLNEARLAARLNHPNIVQNLEVGSSAGRYFLAMEYLEGQPLHRVMQSPGARPNFSLAMRLHLLVQVLAGLHYAHERCDYDGTPLEIVHRDVSPSNVFVTYDGQVKLMDFGIAKARDTESETRIGVFKGKAAYSAPEQIRGERVDRRADVYSAGVLLWEMLTGKRLWAGLTQAETLKQALTSGVPNPRSIEPRLPAALEHICERSVAVDPERRFASAAELASEIEHAAHLHLPAVLTRDIAAVVTEAFENDRRRIAQVLESQLSTGSGSARERIGTSSGARRTRLARAARPLLAYAGSATWGKVLGVGLSALTVAGLGMVVTRHENAPTADPVAAPDPAIATGTSVAPAEIRLGMSAVFSGPSRELGQGMMLGLETRFRSVNDQGGIHGRKVTLTALDDGYEAARTAVTMKELLDERHVFAIVGNVGTPTSVVAAPLASQHQSVFFGAFTGAPALRQDPPDRYVFNYRASYAEETAKSIRYLLETRKVGPEQIVVFAQEDSFGDAGFEGVKRALRGYGYGNAQILRTGYKRNTVDVDTAVARILEYHDQPEPPRPGTPQAADVRARRPQHPVKAVVLVATYRAAAKFIQQVRRIPRLREAAFLNVSFVGSEALAEELKGINPALCHDVFVTQVVPHFNSGSSGVRRYREQLHQYQPQAQPGFISLEGFIVASIFVEALERTGANLTGERLADTLENLKDLDLGFGSKISFSPSEHQGSHKVWGTRLDETCNYQTLELD